MTRSSSVGQQMALGPPCSVPAKSNRRGFGAPANPHETRGNSLGTQKLNHTRDLDVGPLGTTALDSTHRNGIGYSSAEKGRRRWWAIVCLTTRINKWKEENRWTTLVQISQDAELTDHPRRIDNYHGNAEKIPPQTPTLPVKLADVAMVTLR